MLMTLHSACWKYNQVRVEDSPLGYVFDEWLEYFGRHHIHVGCFDLSDTFAVVKMEVSPAGVWQLISSTPRLKEDNAKSLFQETKKVIRAEVKHGPFISLNSCTENRIDSSFFHLVQNQHIDLYNPVRDGVSQF